MYDLTFCATLVDGINQEMFFGTKVCPFNVIFSVKIMNGTGFEFRG